MKISLDTELLSDAIKAAQHLVNAEMLYIEQDGNFLSVTGIGSPNVCRFTVPSKVEAKSKRNSFSITANSFLTAIAKRKGLVLEIGDSTLVVKSERYEATLLTSQGEPVVVIPEEIKKTKSLLMKEDFVNKLAKTLPKLDLKPLLSVYDTLPIGIKATPKGTFVACFDNYQSAFYSDKTLVGDFQIQLPSNLFLTIAREIKDQKYKLSITENAVYAWNENFELSTVLSAGEDAITLDNMIELYKAIKKDTSGHRLVMQTQGVRELIENSRAVYEKDSVFEFRAKGKKCKLELKSSLGTMSTVVLLEEGPDEEVKFTCDFGFFSQLIVKAPETVNLTVNDRMILFTNNPVTYLLSLV